MTTFFKTFLAAIQVPKRIDQVLKDYQRLSSQIDVLGQSIKGDPVPEGTERTVFTMEDE